MAGMLPGVESARRRRCRKSSTGWPDLSSSSSSCGSCSRRSALCLFTSNHKSDLFPERSTMNNYEKKQEEGDAELGAAAREAKERLSERLRSHLYKNFEAQSSRGKATSRRDEESWSGLRRSLGLMMRRKCCRCAHCCGWKCLSPLIL